MALYVRFVFGYHNGQVGAFTKELVQIMYTNNLIEQARIAQLETLAAMNGEENARYYQMAKKEVWEAADKRIAQLEEALKVASEALVPYMKFVDGTQVKNQAAQAYDKINEVIGS